MPPRACEREMTDVAMEAAKGFEGPPKERIWYLMEQVMSAGMARLDLAFLHWSQPDTDARRIFKHVLKRGFLSLPGCFQRPGFPKNRLELATE